MAQRPDPGGLLATPEAERVEGGAAHAAALAGDGDGHNLAC